MKLNLHGQIANIPAHFVEVRVDLDPPHAIEVAGQVDEAMLFFPQLRLDTVLRTQPGANKLTLADRVTNLKSQPAELQMLYHCNFGPPLLGTGARCIAPLKMVAPRDANAAGQIDHFDSYPDPTPGVVETVYFLQLLGDDNHKTLAVLLNAAGDKACAVRFSTAQLPCFTLWKNPGALSDGYVTGLEPGTNFPNPKKFERSKHRVVKLAPGGSWQAELTFEMADSVVTAGRLAAEVQKIQAGSTQIIYRRPKQPYSDVE